jgi:colanic acid/amylovoran biosynthesis glycosyltransferase
MVWIYNLLIHLREYEPWILARRRINTSSFPFDRIHSLDQLSPASQWFNIGISKITGVIPFIEKNARKLQPALVHFHLGNMAHKSLPLKRRLDIPGVLSFYGADAYMYPSVLSNRKKLSVVYNELDRIIVLGPAMQQEMIQLGCPATKIEILHLGIDINKIAFKERCFPTARPIRFLLASSFVDKKGIDITLYALERIKKSIDFEIEIIGDGPLHDVIFEILRKTGLQSRTTWYGYKPYDFLLERAYQCDIFLQASRTAPNNDKEGTPMVFVDVMATGMPVISTFHSDIPEIVKDGINGYLAEENSVDSFESCLLKLINNSNNFGFLSRNCRSHTEQQFNIFLQAGKLAGIYNTLQ